MDDDMLMGLDVPLLGAPPSLRDSVAPTAGIVRRKSRKSEGRLSNDDKRLEVEDDHPKITRHKEKVLLLDDVRILYLWYVRSAPSYRLVFRFLLFCYVFLWALGLQHRTEACQKQNAAWRQTELAQYSKTYPISLGSFWKSASIDLPKLIFDKPIKVAVALKSGKKSNRIDDMIENGIDDMIEMDNMVEILANNGTNTALSVSKNAAPAEPAPAPAPAPSIKPAAPKKKEKEMRIVGYRTLSGRAMLLGGLFITRRNKIEIGSGCPGSCALGNEDEKTIFKIRLDPTKKPLDGMAIEIMQKYGYDNIKVEPNPKAGATPPHTSIKGSNFHSNGILVRNALVEEDDEFDDVTDKGENTISKDEALPDFNGFNFDGLDDNAFINLAKAAAEPPPSIPVTTETLQLLATVTIPFDTVNNGNTFFFPKNMAKDEVTIMMNWLKAHQFLAFNTYEMQLFWSGYNPTEDIITTITWLSKINEAGTWHDYYTPNSVGAQLYTLKGSSLGNTIAASVGINPINWEGLYYQAAGEKKKAGEKKPKMSVLEGSMRTSMEDYVDLSEFPVSTEFFAEPRSGYSDESQVNGPLETFLTTHDIDVILRWGLEILTIILALFLGYIPLMSQYILHKTETCVGAVVSTLPVDSKGFPFIKTAYFFWFLVFPLTIGHWVSLSYYWEINLAPLVEQSLEANTAKALTLSPAETYAYLHTMSFDLYAELIYWQWNFDAYAIANSFTGVVILVLLFEYLAFQRRLSVIIDTFSGLSGDMFHLLMITILTVWAFAYMVSFSAGRQDSGFSNVTEGILNMARSCMGLYKPASVHNPHENPYWKKVPELAPDTLVSESGVPIILFLIFKFIVIMTLFKFVIAFIADSYKETNPKKRGKSKSVLQDLTWLLWYCKCRYFYNNFVPVDHVMRAAKYCELMHHFYWEKIQSSIQGNKITEPMIAQELLYAPLFEKLKERKIIEFSEKDISAKIDKNDVDANKDRVKDLKEEVGGLGIGKDKENDKKDVKSDAKSKKVHEKSDLLLLSHLTKEELKIALSMCDATVTKRNQPEGIAINTAGKEPTQPRLFPGEFIIGDYLVKSIPVTDGEVDFVLHSYGVSYAKARRHIMTSKGRENPVSILEKEELEVFEQQDEYRCGYLNLRQCAQALEKMGHFHAARDKSVMSFLVSKYQAPDADGAYFGPSCFKKMLQDPVFDDSDDEEEDEAPTSNATKSGSTNIRKVDQA